MFQVNRRIVFKEVDEQTVLINIETGLYYSLNDTGSIIFRSLREQADCSEILQRLCDTYGVPEEMAKLDLEEFLRALSDEDILVQSG